MFRSLLYIILLCGFACFSCQDKTRRINLEVPLQSDWKFRQVGCNDWLPALVPGNLYDDLKQNNKNATALDFDYLTWEYTKTFDVPAEVLDQDVIQLCFSGLGPFAEVFLNDSLVLRTDNLYKSWKISCKSLLKNSNNIVRVLLSAHNHKIVKVKPLKNGNFSQNKSNLIDNKRDTFFCHAAPEDLGIWSSIYLKAWSTATINDVYVKPDSISSKKAVYKVSLTINSITDQTVHIDIQLNKVIVVSKSIRLTKGENIIHNQLIIDRPKLWWCNGLGNAALYDLKLNLKKEDEVIAESQMRFGVRTLKIEDQPDGNKEFYVKLNGSPLFLKGAAYNFASRIKGNISLQKRIVDDAVASNYNVVRITGAYADDSFYDLCDQKGILVWQDFSENFSKLPYGTSISENLESEAIEVIKRLRNHPAVAVLFGNDSELQDHSESNNRLFGKDLPDLVNHSGLPVPYASYGQLLVKQPKSFNQLNGNQIGNIVLDSYLSSSCKSQSCRGLSDNADSDLGKRGKNNELLSSYIKDHFNIKEDSTSRSFACWIAHSELIKKTIEEQRIHMPECMGTIFNQFGGRNGCYTVTSDTSLTWKPAQYAIRDAFSHVLVVPTRAQNAVTVYGVSDALKDLNAFLLVKLIDFYGNSLFVRQIPVELKANSAKVLFTVKESELLKNVDVTNCCLVVQVNQANKTMSQNILYFTDLKHLFQPRRNVSVDVNEGVNGYNLILRSPVLVKNLVISTISKSCWFSDNNIDLLPGKRTKISVRYNGSRTELERDIRLQSAIDLK